MTPIPIYSQHEFDELSLLHVAISGGILCRIYIILIRFSDYAVGYQKMIYTFSHYVDAQWTSG